MQSMLETIDSALTDAAKLCDASMETRNPIRFLW
jgi:hypothetical protein